jgi:hypothetical protein
VFLSAEKIGEIDLTSSLPSMIEATIGIDVSPRWSRSFLLSLSRGPIQRRGAKRQKLPAAGGRDSPVYKTDSVICAAIENG